MTDLAIDADATPLHATVGAKFAYGTTGVSQALLCFAVSHAHAVLEEEILIHAGGRRVRAHELAGDHGTRLHLVEEVGDGWLEVTYRAVVDIGPFSQNRQRADQSRPVAHDWACAHCGAARCIDGVANRDRPSANHCAWQRALIPR